MEARGRGAGDDQFTFLGQHDELAVGRNERAALGAFLDPLLLAGRKIEADKIPTTGVAIDSLDRAIHNHGRIEVRAQLLVRPHLLHFVAADCKKRGAVIVAAADQHTVADDERRGGVDIVFGLPFRAPKFATRGGVESDEMQA